jgi:hypothetical protein
MAHICPKCGAKCHCGKDIDDLIFDEGSFGCYHCDNEDDEDDDDFLDDWDDDDHLLNPPNKFLTKP